MVGANALKLVLPVTIGTTVGIGSGYLLQLWYQILVPILPASTLWEVTRHDMHLNWIMIVCSIVGALTGACVACRRRKGRRRAAMWESKF